MILPVIDHNHAVDLAVEDILQPVLDDEDRLLQSVCECRR